MGQCDIYNNIVVFSERRLQKIIWKRSDWIGGQQGVRIWKAEFCAVRKKVNFDNYAFKHCDDLDPSGEIYSDDIVAPVTSEPTEEVEQEQQENTEQINKQKAIEGLNTARAYFMNSNDDCKEEINSIFKLIASIHSMESNKQSKITSFFSFTN